MFHAGDKNSSSMNSRGPKDHNLKFVWKSEVFFSRGPFFATPSGDVKKMLENIGILENMAREECNFTAMRFIEAFRALNWVRKFCFKVLL